MDDLKGKLRALAQGKGNPPPIMKTLGMELVDAGDGKASMRIQVGERFHNPMGTVHGGVMTDLADATMGIAVMTTLAEGESFTTLELKMNFIRPVIEDELTSEAKVVHRGKTIALVESVLMNREGKEVARGLATQMILHGSR